MTMWPRRDSPPEIPEDPDVCPICGSVNSDANGDWACPTAPGFCCDAHEAQYLKAQRDHEEAYVREMEDLARLLEKE